MTDPFVIFSLPRSRTAWLSRFLTYGDWVCCHDSLLKIDGAQHLRELLAIPNTGLAETAMSFAAPLIRRYFPRSRFVVVRRPLEDIEASLSRFPGWEGSHDFFLEEIQRLESISAMPGTLTVNFADLDGVECCAKVFQHCLGMPLDVDHWASLAGVNIQCDMADRVALSVERTPQMTRTMSEARLLMAPVTYQEETWGQMRDDAMPLFQEHFDEADSFPGRELDINFDIIDAMNRAGVLQIMTARAGGALVGYLAFTVEPGIACRTMTFASQNAFFVRKPWRGVTGLRLHRAAIKKLRERGDIDELILRAGVAGSGPKLAPLFKRMGASDHGHQFRLRLVA